MLTCPAIFVQHNLFLLPLGNNGAKVYAQMQKFSRCVSAETWMLFLSAVAASDVVINGNCK